MLKLLLTSILLYSFCLSQAQYDDFSEDALQLAARIVENNQSHVIPTKLIYKLDDALESISNSHSPAANAVVHQYDIHPMNLANTENVFVIIDKNSLWLENLNNTPIHNMVPEPEKLNLKVKEETNDYSMLELSYNDPINMKFVANEVSILDDVWMVEVPMQSLDASDIQVRQISDGFIFTYIYKFNGCETGCEEAHYWEFSVSNNGMVEFINEYGSDISQESKSEKKVTVIDGLRS